MNMSRRITTDYSTHASITPTCEPLYALRSSIWGGGAGRVSSEWPQHHKLGHLTKPEGDNRDAWWLCPIPATNYSSGVSKPNVEDDTRNQSYDLDPESVVASLGADEVSLSKGE
jgi:hypothetical protein